MRVRDITMIVYLAAFALLCQLAMAQTPYPSTSDFGLERPENLPTITRLEVMCGKDHMTVQLSFNAPFHGLVFSKGQYGQSSCIYVEPRTGGANFEFRIYYEKCGTKPDMGGKFYENTVIVQYDSELIEVWDEAKRLRCEWYNDYEKTASKPPMVISDLEVIELNFRGDNVDCWMEIQDGKGPWASPVTGIVPLGSTLTMVVAINDQAGEFDMRVKSCEASDGVNAPIFLSDENGCVLRPKMISKFLKLRNNDGRASVLTYAHFHAFKFPDSMAVHIRCKVEICRFGCPDHCQRPVAGNPIGDYSQLPVQAVLPQVPLLAGPPVGIMAQPAVDPFFAGTEVKPQFEVAPKVIPQPALPIPPAQRLTEKTERPLPPFMKKPMNPQNMEPQPPRRRRPLPPPAKDRSEQKMPLPAKSPTLMQQLRELPQPERLQQPQPLNDFPAGPRSLERRRRDIVLDRHSRSTEDIGVTTIYQVISEADLEFTPSRHEEGVTVFQGHRESDVVYGVCLPAPGFSALFVLIAMCTVISVLVAGFMCHHRQLQKDNAELPATPHQHHLPQTHLSNMAHFLRTQFSGYTH